MAAYYETHEPPHCPTCDCATHRTAELLWIGSFRYHLGRRTYAVNDFCNALIASWAALPGNAKRIVRNELEHELRMDAECRHQGLPGPLGDACDRDDWERVRNHIQRPNAQVQP